jgi:hypothetical protein
MHQAQQVLSPQAEDQRLRMHQAQQVLSPQAETQRQRMAIPQALPPDVEAQRTRMAQDAAKSRLLSPEEEAQQTRMAQAKLERKPMTDEQAKAAGFADRMADAEKIIGPMNAPGYFETQRAKYGGTLGNYTLSPEYQKFSQAKRNFVNAVLRRESGAVINPDEFVNADLQYFPQPGEGKEVIAQKAQNRAAAYAGMVRSAGQSYSSKQEAPASGGGWTDLGGGVRIREKR